MKLGSLRSCCHGSMTLLLHRQALKPATCPDVAFQRVEENREPARGPPQRHRPAGKAATTWFLQAYALNNGEAKKALRASDDTARVTWTKR